MDPVAIEDPGNHGNYLNLMLWGNAAAAPAADAVDGHAMEPPLQNLMGPAEAVINQVADQRNTIKVHESYIKHVLAQREKDQRTASNAIHGLHCTVDQQQSTIHQLGENIRQLETGIQYISLKLLPLVAMDPSNLEIAQLLLQEMLLQGFHQLAFPSGVAGLGCIRVLLDYQVRPGDADEPDKLLSDLEDLARSFQKAIPGMQASLQFGPFCLNNVPPISGDAEMWRPIAEASTIDVQSILRQGDTMWIAGANLADRSSSPASIYLREGSKLHSTIPVKKQRVFTASSGTPGNHEGRVSELEFTLPSMERGASQWTLEVSRHGFRGTVRLGKLPPTPVFAAVTAVGPDLVRIAGRYLLKDGAAASFFIGQGLSEPKLLQVVAQKDTDEQGLQLQQVILSTKGRIDYMRAPSELDINGSHGGLGGSSRWSLPLAALRRHSAQPGDQTPRNRGPICVLGDSDAEKLQNLQGASVPRAARASVPKHDLQRRPSQGRPRGSSAANNSAQPTFGLQTPHWTDQQGEWSTAAQESDHEDESDYGGLEPMPDPESTENWYCNLDDDTWPRV